MKFNNINKELSPNELINGQFYTLLQKDSKYVFSFKCLKKSSIFVNEACCISDIDYCDCGFFYTNKLFKLYKANSDDIEQFNKIKEGFKIHAV